MTRRHSIDRADVLAAFEAFAELAPRAANLRTEAGSPTLYVIEESGTELDGWTLVGHAPAYRTIRAYLVGRRNGWDERGGEDVAEVLRRSLIREAEARIDAGPITGGEKRIIPSPNQSAPAYGEKGGKPATAKREG